MVISKWQVRILKGGHSLWFSQNTVVVVVHCIVMVLRIVSTVCSYKFFPGHIVAFGIFFVCFAAIG